VPKIEGLK
jgi:hypothetical protein